MDRQLVIYDCTLREGAQSVGVTFSVEDKVKIVGMLDDMGVHYIEAGNPGSNPKDQAFYETMYKNPPKHAKLVAFGSTCRVDMSPESDPNVTALLSAQTPAVCVFGKTWKLHIHDVLHATEAQNLEIIANTVRYLKSQGREVIYDAEHFFDGWKDDATYALQTIQAAQEAGADWICLCDTNGGSLPHEIDEAFKQAKAVTTLPMGIHCHNDSRMADANSIIAVQNGAAMVQVTLNGCGERCGNADMFSLVPNLQLKMGNQCLPDAVIRQFTPLALAFGEIANSPPDSKAPYVGRHAFLHKAGMHIDAVQKNPKACEHVPPESVGNERGFVVSEVAGRGAVYERVRAIVPELAKDAPEIVRIVERLKTQEMAGYQYEGADASFELLVLREIGRYKPFFQLENFQVVVTEPAPTGLAGETATAMIELLVDGEREVTAAKGNGPVNALDKALRKALGRFYPALHDFTLIDYKVRVMESDRGTGAMVRVLIESGDGRNTWSTVGVSPDIINASWQALVDAIEYRLMKL